MKKSNQAVAAIIIVLLLAMSGYLFYKYQLSQTQLKKLQQNPQSAAQDETKKLVAQVGNLMVLPTTETPTVATVIDVSKLKNQPFFKNAKNGDKVLIYTVTKQAIMYRPSTNKIISVAPVNIGPSANATVTPAQKSKVTPTSTPKPTVAPTETPTAQ